MHTVIIASSASQILKIVIHVREYKLMNAPLVLCCVGGIVAH